MIDFDKVLAKKPAANQPRAKGIPITRSPIAEVGLSDDERRAFAKKDLEDRRTRSYERFRLAVLAFERAASTGTVVEAMVPAGKGKQHERRIPLWDAVSTAYQALRALYVPRRATGRVARGEPDQSLAKWTKARNTFFDDFYGKLETDGKRRFGGVPKDVADIVKIFQKLHNKWHKWTPEYREYMRLYMAKRRAAAKAKAKEVPTEVVNVARQH